MEQHQTPAAMNHTGAAPARGIEHRHWICHNIAVVLQMYLFRQITLFLLLHTFFRNSGTKSSTKVKFSEINSVN
jgi:hypothetical protein